MAFVTLHLDSNGEEIVVNSDKIEFLFPTNGRTKVVLLSEAFIVTEQLYTIVELIEPSGT